MQFFMAQVTFSKLFKNNERRLNALEEYQEIVCKNLLLSHLFHFKDFFLYHPMKMSTKLSFKSRNVYVSCANTNHEECLQIRIIIDVACSG